MGTALTSLEHITYNKNLLGGGFRPSLGDTAAVVLVTSGDTSARERLGVSMRSEVCGAHCHDDGLSAFLSARARLFGIAYRILKNAAEAEDIVQDVWIRWQTTDRSAVRDAAAFLATTATRLAINAIQSARSRRETCVESFRESVDTCPDPELKAERNEELQRAVHVLLEKLSPAERAAYVLREAFDYSYHKIASLLRVQEANVRQLVSRARRHIADARHAAVNSAQQQRFLAAFAAAAQKGALTKLESFLVGRTNGTARTNDAAACTWSTVVEPKAVPFPRWPLMPQLDAKVA